MLWIIFAEVGSKYYPRSWDWFFPGSRFWGDLRSYPLYLFSWLNYKNITSLFGFLVFCGPGLGVFVQNWIYHPAPPPPLIEP